MPRYWYTDASYTKIDPATRISGGKATASIFQVMLADGGTYGQVTLWAARGAAAGTPQTSDNGALPPLAPMSFPAGGTSGGTGTNALPAGGTTGQVLSRTADGYAWLDPGVLQGPAGSPGSPGAAGSPGPASFSFGRAGSLAVSNGVSRLYNDAGRALTITRIRATLSAAAVGACTVRLRVFTATDTNTASPTVSVTTGGLTGLSSGLSLAWDDGGYLLLDITAVDAGNASHTLTSQVTAA